MGHIIIISILFVNSLLNKDLFTRKLVQLIKLINSFNLSTCLLVHLSTCKNSSTYSTKQLLKVLEDRAFGAVITTEVFALA